MPIAELDDSTSPTKWWVVASRGCSHRADASPRRWEVLPKWLRPSPIRAARSCSGTAQLRRVVGGVQRRLRVRGPGRCPRRTAAASRMGPAMIAGGSGGARVSLLTAARHPDIAAGLAMWWISGGVPGLLQLANFYFMPSADAACTEVSKPGCRVGPVAGGPGRASGQPAAFPRDGPPGVPRRHEPVDAGLLPLRRFARPRARRRRCCPPRRTDPGVPERRIGHVAHPCHV